jgi:large-conductance mechanosensitive channel
MKGALVFLIAFFAVLLISLAVEGIPPGKMIYDAIATETDYEVLGVEVPTLVSAVFNAVIYGVVIWLIYDLIIARKKPKENKRKEEKAASGPGTQP